MTPKHIQRINNAHTLGGGGGGGGVKREKFPAFLCIVLSLNFDGVFVTL